MAHLTADDAQPRRQHVSEQRHRVRELFQPTLPVRLLSMARSLRAKLLITAAVASAVIIFTGRHFFHLTTLERLELSTLDYRFALRGPVALDSAEVCIVEIAEDSFRSIPDRFPWPRSQYAHL